MKISKDVAKLIIDSVRSNVKPSTVSGADGAKMNAYYLDDATVSFTLKNNKEVFFGASFEMLGKDFHIINTLDALVVNSEGPEEQVYLVDDEAFIKVIENFFTWRMSALNTMNV